MLVMQVVPLCFDSFSVRSQCVKVVTKDCKILIDPGVALGPIRYGLSPSILEWKELETARKKIMEESKDCDIIIVTHYHYDHIPLPEDEEFTKTVFTGKKVYTKDIHKFINYSQRDRGREFENELKDITKSFEFADKKEIKIGKTSIIFSHPVFHGQLKTKLGYVIMVCVKNGRDCFVYGSDAQGPIDQKAVEFVIQNNPNILILDGPITYMLHYRLSEKDFKTAINNMKKIIDKVRAEKIIYDHHLTRDLKYVERIKEVISYARKKHKKIITAADHIGEKNLFLEARRKELSPKQ
jgi:predicted metallo-beta-lactamase superfamily hydrolase